MKTFAAVSLILSSLLVNVAATVESAPDSRPLRAAVTGSVGAERHVIAAQDLSTGQTAPGECSAICPLPGEPERTE